MLEVQKQSTHFTTHFATQSTHFMTQLTHFTTHPLEQEQIKALSSYTFHHLNANSEGDNKCTIDMVNIHTCATCGKIFRRKYDLRRHENTVHSEDTSSGEDEDSKSEDSESENEEQSEVETSESETSSNVDLEDNDIYQRWYERSMQVSEPARTEKYEKYVGAGMSEQQAREKAYERTLWATKSNFFDTYEEFLEATVQLEEDDTHQEIIADIEEKMRRDLDTSKAVKRVLPKHKHHFESLFEYKSDDEDANDSDSDSLEDVLYQPPAKRMGPFPSY